MADAESRVCHGCFGDEVLKREIRRKGQRQECAYCGKTRITLSLDEVANLFEAAIQTHYERTPSEPTPFEQAMQHEDVMGMWYREGQPISDLMQEIGETTEDIAEDLRDLLHSRHSTHEDFEMGNETEFDPEAHYEGSAVGAGVLDTEWTLFEHNLKTQSRYFSSTAMEMLDKVFQDLEKHLTYQGASVIVDAGPNAPIKTLYRARVFQSEKSLLKALERPEISIGPPPPLIAGAGRMNARGIPVFYGATHAEAALAEVRPPVGSTVVVAQFEIIRPLRLLDVESLQMLSVGGSPFDPKYFARLQKASFLRGLSERITMPVMPEDETLNYIATQVIAEYLASLEHPTLDGMIYPSVQAAENMKNVVLFHKASVVAKVVRPEGVEFGVSNYENYEDGPEIEYTVYEEFDSEAASLSQKQPTWKEIMAEAITMAADERQPTLQLSKENVWVHHIKRVSIASEPHRVRRSEWDKKAFREFEESQKKHAVLAEELTDPIDI